MARSRARRNHYIQNLRNFNILIPWDDFVYILTRDFGFEMDEKKGSSARAFTRGDVTFTAYKPHGRRRGNKHVSAPDRRKAIRALIRLGILEEEESQ
jgi:hypothetical protein